jgi:hypothetical protein
MVYFRETRASEFRTIQNPDYTIKPEWLIDHSITGLEIGWSGRHVVFTIQFLDQ